jgi:uncharacterized protein (DUF433 family)
MGAELLHDRGRGPELVGTRITVYNLLPDLLDPEVTEAQVCRIYNLTPAQVAAVRAYILNNPDTVLARHLEIEERMAAGNPPELVERMQKMHETFQRFKAWAAEEQKEIASDKIAEAATGKPQTRVSFPSFRDWLASQESHPAEGP